MANSFVHFITSHIHPEHLTLKGVVAYILHSNIINLIIVAIFLVWIFKKFSIISAVDKVIEDIKAALSQAEQKREGAIQELKDVKNQVKNLDQTKKEIVSETEKTAGLLKDKISEETKALVFEIEKNTEKFLEAEQKMTTETISREVAQKALDIAQEHIKKAINDDMQQKYIDEFIDNLDETKV
jgi:F0F1-type ATP synthase membrane subunit b/b'